MNRTPQHYRDVFNAILGYFLGFCSSDSLHKIYTESLKNECRLLKPPKNRSCQDLRRGRLSEIPGWGHLVPEVT